LAYGALPASKLSCDPFAIQQALETPPDPREGLNPPPSREKSAVSLYAAGFRVIGELLHGGSAKQLPASLNLSPLKKQAKEVLRACDRNDPGALPTFLEFLSSAQNSTPESLATPDLRLHDAQSPEAPKTASQWRIPAICGISVTKSHGRIMPGDPL
jgi:hypothetical protein